MTRAEQSRILEALNQLSLETIGKEIPLPERARSPARSADSPGLVKRVLHLLTRRREMDVYRENLLSNSGLPNALGRTTEQGLADICATLRLLESPDVVNALPGAKQIEIEDAVVQARRIVILGELPVPERQRS